MKRVLITGAGSYVGTHVMRRLQEEPNKFEVRELDVKGDAWRGFDFAGFDAVFHVAGIAHVSTDPSMEPLDMQVNRDFAIEHVETCLLSRGWSIIWWMLPAVKVEGGTQ